MTDIAGNGINPEVDNQKDFIGRLGAHYAFSSISEEADIGMSMYLGKVKRPEGKVIYTVNFPMVSSVSATDVWANREYV